MVGLWPTAFAARTESQDWSLAVLKGKFGWTGVEVPVIGQGTWMIEGSRVAEQRAIQSLRLGLDLGMAHIDTAEMYGSGRAEELAGEAISGRRDEVFLVSKVLPSNASFAGTIQACKRSLERLKTDHLDLYLLHWESRYPLSETMRALETLVTEGKTRFIGVSNFDLGMLQAAERALKKEQLACNQVLYHLGDRGIERKLIPYCTAAGIAVVGYSPFGHSDFPSSKSSNGRILAQIAERHGRTPRQIVLNFLTRQPGVFTIPKSSQPEHVRENSEATEWELDKEDLRLIDRAFPAPDHDVPLGIL
jgi:diketogulonate reductase-like aldo/keto reductase